MFAKAQRPVWIAQCQSHRVAGSAIRRWAISQPED
ncbi:hypothetical protein DSC_09045 [Pseudoxanthomonas spadix BD-a59]|uniref:Uncharacterized protein n=1 Tax=Pseudoxanthomonas spadix (strain BD-a59) TaxID=1045855 RepID=G7UVZ0_PSEUP|nr:hypothetical protein DSC_09045 [Pseudoxanthomonas spadix BD-a59]